MAKKEVKKDKKREVKKDSRRKNKKESKRFKEKTRCQECWSNAAQSLCIRCFV